VVWIKGRCNVADAITKDKKKASNSFKNLVNSNRLDISDRTIG